MATLVRVLLLAIVMFVAVDYATVAAPAVVDSSDVVVIATNICSGEAITMTGSVHTVTRVDGAFIDGQLSYSGMRGVGADGTAYVFPFAQGSSIHVQPGVVQSFQVNYRLIGRGQAPDTQLHELFHATFDANGVLTSLTHELHVTCG